MIRKIEVHPFDLVVGSGGSFELFAEELPEGVQHLSDCLSTGSSASTVASGAGTMSSVGCFSSAASVAGCGS